MVKKWQREMGVREEIAIIGQMNDAERRGMAGRKREEKNVSLTEHDIFQIPDLLSRQGVKLFPSKCSHW